MTTRKYNYKIIKNLFQRKIVKVTDPIDFKG